MKIEVFPVGPFDMNCHLVYNPESKEAVVIDPGDEIPTLSARIRELDLKVSHILLTHGHIDHVAFAEDLHKELKVPMLLHKADWAMAAAAPKQAAMYGLPPGPVPVIDGELAPCPAFSAGGFEFEIRFTPGHSPGSVTLISHPNKVAIVGDVLFNGSIGRTDLPGGKHAELIASIKNQLLNLPDDYAVYPGHGPTTTIGKERRSNPFLR